jgi:PAS domain S-box-containing protein
MKKVGGKRRRPAGPGRAVPSARRARAPQPQLDYKRLLLDLRVHQEELRQQNDELRTTQLELEEARDRYSDLYDLAPLPYLTLTRAGIVADANRTCQIFLGLSLDRLVGRALITLIPLELRPSLRRLIARTRTSGAMVLPTRIRAASAEVPVELHMRPTAAGMVYMVIVDLTDRERTAAEKQALLVEAEVARAANAARDQFLANLSHELRTPLTPVVMAVSGLQPRLAEGVVPTASELHDLFSMVRRNLDYETRLIDDLLDDSRLAAGKLVLRRQEVDLHSILRDAVDLIAEEAKRKGLRLEVALEAGRCTVDGDALRLRQVFWNLLRNAVKFTPRDGSVNVRSRNRGDLVEVEVSDSGIGIAPEDLPPLFDRFSQTRAGEQAGGLGIGLAIVRGIVESHGGRVSAGSAGAGKGARFLVELAALHAEAAGPLATEKTPTPTALPGAAAPGGRILLVDDHEETAAILAELLRAQGYEVTVAHTLAAALRAGAEQLDLLITDIGLPDGSGLDLVTQLRPRLTAPAIALTGYGQQHDVERSRAAGFARHLVKPVEFPKLLAVIHELRELRA